MDVVRQNIVDDLKGSIRVNTRPGEGTRFDIRLPLTMAVIHVLFVSSSDMTFTLPAHMVSEVLKTPVGEIIQVVNKKAIRLRDQLIPIAWLNDLTGLPPSENASGEHLIILILNSGNEQLGLVVDELINEESAVIKPLPPHMARNQWVSGCIISGNNEILNVLHIPKLIEAAKLLREGRSPHEKKKSELADDMNTIRILVVDDSATTREIEKSILESYGYQVTLAGDGQEGLEKALKEKYDLVVTDVEMPRMDGFSLTENLRKDEVYRETPIILVTSLDKESDKQRGIDVGADAYIVKGDFEQSNLLDTIRTLAG